MRHPEIYIASCYLCNGHRFTYSEYNNGRTYNAFWLCDAHLLQPALGEFLEETVKPLIANNVDVAIHLHRGQVIELPNGETLREGIHTLHTSRCTVASSC